MMRIAGVRQVDQERGELLVAGADGSVRAIDEASCEMEALEQTTFRR